jgi:hemerythrin-like domain-containing protein
MANEIANLRKEHVNFRKLLDLLETQLGLFHRGESPDYQLMTDIVYYMTHYPDVFHHPKEDVIFARLLKRDSSVAQRVEELARQHHVIGESGARLHENLESVITGALMPRQMIETPGLLYVSYYRTHMDKEEHELFVLAEQKLRDDDWKKINAETRSQPDPIFGATVEERYCTVCRHIGQTVGAARAS